MTDREHLQDEEGCAEQTGYEGEGAVARERCVQRHMETQEVTVCRETDKPRDPG